MGDRSSERVCTRRTLLSSASGAAAAGAVAGASTPGLAQERPYGGYLGDTSNFGGTTVDMTGRSEVTVSVGAEGNDGVFAFSPPAIRVDPGTTVVWEWTGQGGSHNVVDEDGAFESELASEEGATFEQTFEDAGLARYYCSPHRGLGMKGVVAVGDTAEGEVATPAGDTGSEGTDGGGSGGSDEEPTAATQLTIETFLAMLAIAVLSPIVFLLVVRRRLQRAPRDR